MNYFGLLPSLALVVVIGAVDVNATDGGTQPVVTTCSSNGTLDPTWNGTGIAETNFSTYSEQARSVAIQSDGKIVVAGSGDGSNAFALARYNTDGTPDLAFGTDGKVVTSFIVNGTSGGSFANAVAIQPDGKIVAGGTSKSISGRSAFTLTRYNEDGSLDISFGSAGKVLIYVGIGEDRVNSLAIQPDGKIVAGGYRDNGDYKDAAVVRLHPSGSLDSSWGIGGKAITSFPSLDSRIFSIEIQPDGKVVAGGYAGILRYNTNGTLDTSWGGTGRVAALHSVTSIAVQDDGKVVAGGSVWLGVESDSAISRFNADGTPDTSWDGDGSVVTRVGEGSNDEFRSVAIQSDGKVVAAGFSYQGFTIVRYNRYGGLDASWGGTGIVITIDQGLDEINDVVIQPDGKIIGAGFNRMGDDEAFAVARYAGCVSRQVLDFDGDGRTDSSVFREDTWYIGPSTAPNTYYGVQWGGAADRLVPADFDGDLKTDIAVWRADGASAVFYILQSSTGTFRIEQFAGNNDDPSMVGDWDGDGKADLAVYSNGLQPGDQSFFIIRGSAYGPFTIQWGVSGDEPLRGDFDGDGKMDAAVYRASDNVWYILQSSNGQPRYVYSGGPANKRVSGDFDGDGKTDIAIYQNGAWAVLQSSNNQGLYAWWGLSTDELVPGDYDGDGRTDFAVWRDGGYWILDSSTSHYTYRQFGQAGDKPIASAFIR